MATHSSILACIFPWTEDPLATVHGVTKSQTRLSDFHSHSEHYRLTVMHPSDEAVRKVTINPYLKQFFKIYL